MGIYIKGMAMPKVCYDCDFCTYGFCSQINRYVTDSHSREEDCPLIPVPSHGDLIDRDAFLAEQRHLYCENCERRKGMKNGKMKFVYDIGDAPCRSCGYGDVLDDIEDAPTIIEAEEGE